jgi:ATP-dependent DNA helicase RecG
MLNALHEGQTVTLTVHIDKHERPAKTGLPYRVTVSDETGFMTLVFFHGKTLYLEKSLPKGEKRIVSGKIEFFKDKAQMIHPDYIGKVEDIEKIAGVEPVYPLTEGLGAKVLIKAMHAAIARIPQLPEWIDPNLKKQRQWPEWDEALKAVHRPESDKDLLPNTPARERLAYDELLVNQLALQLVRDNYRKSKGRKLVSKGHLRQKVLAALPFDLTNAQKAAIAEIDQDMATDLPMLRLLQGDVGSGKTLVALAMMLNAVENGLQAAIMAPTEILARQHVQTFAPLAEKAGFKIAALTGRDKGKAREQILNDLKDGNIDILIGTHALLEDPVQFKDLGAIVIDEQHRFGVHQRLAILNKGQAIDMLVMTATPIPRTLVLSLYGDLDVSRLLEKPPGRKPIATRTIPLSRLDEVIEGIKRAVKDGAQVYWICPLVEESEILDLAAAEERHLQLKFLLGDKAGLVHGRMKAAEKESVMQDFASGKIRVLVSTTVIEVGVNVPNATIMIIDHAERFGLSQLHQLRGRVGRGSAQSSCILLYQKLSPTAQARLSIMRETEDGFKIAEEDLRLRGAGEILGTRQSGLPATYFADFAAHQDLVQISRDDARLVLEKDRQLLSPRGTALRNLIYLFEKDSAFNYLRSG